MDYKQICLKCGGTGRCEPRTLSDPDGQECNCGQIDLKIIIDKLKTVYTNMKCERHKDNISVISSAIADLECFSSL